MGLLEGKIALITGASRGIGKAIALKFAKEGAGIAFTDVVINEDTVSELQGLGAKVLAITADATDFNAAQSVVDQVVAEFGRLDILVNNAGITRDSLLLRMDEDKWDLVLKVNLKSAFNYSHAAVPVMARQRKGSIVHMCSYAGLHGNVGQCNYAASKAGLVGFSKSLAREMGSRNIRSNCIAPGFIISDMTAAVPEEIREKWLKEIPMRRGGTVEEVADIALFLASDMSSYVSGETISCDGAFGV